MRLIRFAAVVLIGLSGCNQNTNVTSASSSDSSTPVVDASAPVSQKVIASTPTTEGSPISLWTYDEYKDEMRGSSLYIAQLPSSNYVLQAFPYNQGETKLTLTLRKSPKYGKNIYFQINQGQLPCFSGLDECKISVKFDNNPIMRFPVAEAGDGSSDTLFIINNNYVKKFIKHLRTANKLIVEVNIYDKGMEQFTFEPSGLDWQHF